MANIKLFNNNSWIYFRSNVAVGVRRAVAPNACSDSVYTSWFCRGIDDLSYSVPLAPAVC